MNAETLQYLTLKGMAGEERVWRATSDFSHFYEWMFEYFKNGIIDKDRLVGMISERRERVLDELLSLELIVPESKRITK